jgi:hypothetical protein
LELDSIGKSTDCETVAAWDTVPSFKHEEVTPLLKVLSPKVEGDVVTADIDDKAVPCRKRRSVSALFAQIKI